jgi:hypothetical protein
MSDYLKYRQQLKLGIKPAPQAQGKAGKETDGEKGGEKVKPAKGRKTPIKKASKKRAKELREYKPVRRSFLKAHPTCEVKLPGCQGKATEIHHQAGREGKKLLDVTDFLSCCRSCHRNITDDSREAIASGHSKTRLGKAQK